MKPSDETFPLRENGHCRNGNAVVELYPNSALLKTDLAAENGHAKELYPQDGLESSSSESEDSYGQDNEKRGTWGHKIEFFLAIMGYTVGIGSVWRFPITCSRNGGGAFLIPFFFFLITAGGPLYYMEVCLGQFTGKSAGLAFEFCPLLKGVGPLQVALSLTVIWYSIFVLAWTFYFLYNSLFATLPWTTCGNWWNTPNCQGTASLWTRNVTEASVTSYHHSSIAANMTVSSANMTSTNLTSHQYSSSALEFWHAISFLWIVGTDIVAKKFDYLVKRLMYLQKTTRYNAVGRSTGLEDLGGLQLHLVICSFFAWTFVVLAVLKGAKTLGKVVYVTATVPFLFLGIMLVRGVTLDGATEGIVAFVRPDFEKLLSFQVWLEAAIQVFYSLGPTWGGVITMASYNKFHQQSFWATTLCVASVGFTSFFNGLVVFTILGFMAKEAGMDIQEVASASGPGLAFVAFPTALSHMPVPQMWSVLFFLMLITVVFDSLFGMFETVTCGIIDVFPQQLTDKRIQVNIVCGVVFFLLGLPLTLNGGIYIFQLADWYFASFALLVGSALEAIGICWCYGTDRFSKDIEMMTGRKVSALLRIMWTIIIPVFVIVTFLILLTRYSIPDYGDGYVYPNHSIVIAVLIGMSPIIIMLGIAVKESFHTQGTIRQRVFQLLTPTKLWQPNEYDARETYRLKPYRYASSFTERVKMNCFGPKDNSLL